MAYQPETKFQISDDNRLVYNLYHKPFSQWRTDRHLSNDICVSIEARHMSDKFQSEIAQIICDALNARYPVLEG